jgi:hypothetical protein
MPKICAVQNTLPNENTRCKKILAHYKNEGYFFHAKSGIISEK